jgi:acyl carrier protein
VPSVPQPSSAASSLPSAEAIRAFIVSRVAEEMKIDQAELDTRVPFASYGLDSIVAFTITGDIAAWLERELEATLLWEYPTIEAVSEFLAADRDATSNAA